MTARKQRVEDLQERIEELEYTLGHVAAVEAGCSSIAIEWKEVGGISIGLNSVGDAVRVEFNDTLTGMYGWDAE